MDYTLIVASASRPHLLRPTLFSLLDQVDQKPALAVLHDDPVFPGRLDAVRQVFWEVMKIYGIDVHPHYEMKPKGHGSAVRYLLKHTPTEYFLYSQDDHVVVRPLPIKDALDVMTVNRLHHIRFNKRDTLPYKDTWQGQWLKVPEVFEMSDGRKQTLCVSDHWYFQTSLGRTSVLRAAVEWLATKPHDADDFNEHFETKVNKLLDGDYGAPHELIGHYRPPITDLVDRTRHQPLRANVQRTFIWGGVDEKRYIVHCGHRHRDWAGGHAREAAEAASCTAVHPEHGPCVLSVHDPGRGERHWSSTGQHW